MAIIFINQWMDSFWKKRRNGLQYLTGPAGEDLTSRFMQFAEDYLTNKKGNPQHNPTVNSCLVRIPGTFDSKCGQTVRLCNDGMSEGRRYAH